MWFGIVNTPATLVTVNAALFENGCLTYDCIERGTINNKKQPGILQNMQ